MKKIKDPYKALKEYLEGKSELLFESSANTQIKQDKDTNANKNDNGTNQENITSQSTNSPTHNTTGGKATDSQQPIPQIQAIIRSTLPKKLNDKIKKSKFQVSHTEIISQYDILKFQKEDTHLQQMFVYLESGKLPTNEAIARRIYFQAQQIVQLDGILYIRRTSPSGRIQKSLNLLLLVPEKLRFAIIESTHSCLAHSALSTLYSTLAERFYWINMRNDCEKFIQNCELCQKSFSKREIYTRAPIIGSQFFLKISARYFGSLSSITGWT